jgi:hypothetical protein
MIGIISTGITGTAIAVVVWDFVFQYIGQTRERDSK